MKDKNIGEIAAIAAEKLQSIPEGSALSSAELLMLCGYDLDVFSPSELMEYHQQLFKAAEAVGIELDMSAHELRFEGIPYNLKFTVRRADDRIDR